MRRIVDEDGVEDFILESAGNTHAVRFWPKSRCGGISDGIGMITDGRGAFVISFKSFEEAYLEAKKCRALLPEKQTNSEVEG